MYQEIHLTSGLSNISFGLPAGKYIIQAFLMLAMNAGKEGATLNPSNKDIRGLIYAKQVLLEKNDFCLVL